MSSTSLTSSHFAEVKNLRLHYLECGTGEPVLLLHGWPTSSHLWRNLMPILGQRKRAIALDLPGYGLSDKPLDTVYSFGFYERVIEGFLDELGIVQTDLVVHDLGGPVGMLWAARHPEKVSRLALLNTLVYPELSWAVKLFGVAIRLPLLRYWLTSAGGLKSAIKFGVCNKQHITDEVMQGYQAPFNTRDARRALLRAAQGLSLKGFREISDKLPQFQFPVRIIYGERDRILPDVADTMRRIKNDLPQAEITSLANCGHFLQEDEPETVAALLNEFLKPMKVTT